MSNELSRRRFLQLVGLAAGAAVLSACGTKTTQSSGSSTSKKASKGKTKVTLWSSYSGKNGEAEATLVKNFNESQDAVELEYQFQGSYEECAQKLTAALQAKTTPELCLLSDVWWFKFYTNQVIAPLDELVETAGIDRADYQDPLINEGIRGGTLWWIPFARSTPLFYYNKEMWSAAGLPDRGPETWDEFVEWAPKLVKKEGGEVKTVAFSHPDGASYIAWLFQGVAWQFGGKYSDPDFTMHMTHDNTLAAGQFYSDTVYKYEWARPTKDMGTDFVNGLTAAAMMSTGSMGGLKANAQFEFGTAFLPKKDHFGCCTGGAGLSVLKDKKDNAKEAAMAYIAFATNTENTAFWSRSSGYMPVRKSAVNDAEMVKYFEEFPQFKTAVEQLELTQPQDSARVWVPNGDQIIGKGLEMITVQNGKVDEAFASVQETLVQTAKPVIEALAKIEK